MRFISGAAVCSVLLFATPAVAQGDPNASLAQDLSSCAGAVAAFGDLDVIAYPSGASGEWADVLGRILARLNVEPGVEGMTGRYAASAARAFWREQSRSRQQAAASRCRERFAAQ